MIYSVYLPLVAAAAVALTAPWVARRLAPPAASWFLVIAATISAVATAVPLVLLVIGGLVKLLPVWGVAVTRAHLVGGRDAVSWPIGLVAAVLLEVLTSNVIRQAYRQWRTLRDIRLIAQAGGGGLVVLEDARPYAYAVPGPVGAVIVSTGILDTLTEPERRALLAHERAHLAHHHSALQVLVTLATAVNPLLLPVRRHAKVHLERWADEVAAEQASRPVMARSLARAALASVRTPSGMLAYATDHVRERLAALAEPRRRSHWSRAAPSVVLVILAGGTLLDAVIACTKMLAIFYP